MRPIEYCILFVLVFVIAFGIISLINYSGKTVGDPAETESGVEYGKFTIEGMPCIFYKEGSGNNQRGGLTCNWEMWKGE